MAIILYGLRESALAILIIFLIAVIGPPRDLNPIKSYLHQAFWCCVVETAVWCPAEVTTFFMYNKRLIPPRILLKLDPFISFIWCEMTAHFVAQTVQPFIVHASLSPSLTGASSPRIATWGTLAHCVELLCVLQIIHSVSLFVRSLQRKLEYLADMSNPNIHPEIIPINLFHILGFLHGYLGRLYTTAALYLERIAAGMLVTSLTVAYESLDGLEYWAFTATAAALLLGADVRAWVKVLEWDAEGDELPRDRPGGRRGWQRTTSEETINRLWLRCNCIFESLFRRVVPWRVGRRWRCPELAALWPEGELWQFYVESLASSPSLALRVPRSRDGLRERFADQWRRAGLTRDFVLGDYSTIPTRVPTQWFGHLCHMILGKIMVVLIWFLKVAFVWFFSSGVTVLYIWWNEKRKAESKLRRA